MRKRFARCFALALLVGVAGTVQAVTTAVLIGFSLMGVAAYAPRNLPASTLSGTMTALDFRDSEPAGGNVGDGDSCGSRLFVVSNFPADLSPNLQQAARLEGIPLRPTDPAA